MGTGAFSEGVIIAAQTTDATDDAIQANLTSVYK
jgi:Alpha-L-arabinofuranosidase B, catalytic